MYTMGRAKACNYRPLQYYEASIEASYLEVYNEKPRDLLVNPIVAREPLQVRESPEVGVFVEGAHPRTGGLGREGPQRFSY